MFRVSYSPGYVAPLPEGHRFPMKKFSGLYSALTQSGLLEKQHIVEPKMVDFIDLYLVHTPDYSNRLWAGGLTEKEIRNIGLTWSPELAVRSRLAVQGTINAAIMALQDGMAGNLAGGTHHAMPQAGEGFCVFNDVAVAIRVLRQAKWIQKALVVDCDVHQGNGTASIFRDDPDVFTFSIHAEKNYPFKKPPSTLDVGLPDNTADREYLLALDAALMDISKQFTPDIVFYLAGVDPLETDYFGRLSLTLAGLKNRDYLVTESFAKMDCPVVLLLSGGYAPALEETVYAHSILFHTASKIFSRYYDVR